MNNITLEDKAERSKQITRTSTIGIITNVFLSGFKAAVGLITGSLAIILDAVNNLTDALSSVITIAGIKLARKKPDAKHPFGHGRIEYFSAIVISLIVLVTGATSLVESIKKIFEPTLPEYSAAAIVIICVAIVTKLLLGRFVKKQGEKYNMLNINDISAFKPTITGFPTEKSEKIYNSLVDPAYGKDEKYMILLNKTSQHNSIK